MRYAPELIEAARARLAWLAEHDQPAFWLACEAAHHDRSPRDPNGGLSDNRHLTFTNSKGDWKEGYRELVVMLTAVDPSDDMNYVVKDAQPVPVVAAEAA